MAMNLKGLFASLGKGMVESLANREIQNRGAPGSKKSAMGECSPCAAHAVADAARKQFAGK